MSKEQQKYLKKLKRNKIKILFYQIAIFVIFIIIWQYLSNKNLINTFITSSPKNIIITLKNLYTNNNLMFHILITTKETLISFTITTFLSLLISIILYNFKIISKILDPYLTVLNSLPKVALGPIIIIWIGANTKSIITMAILISIIVSIQTIYNGFENTDKLKIKLFQTIILVITLLDIPISYIVLKSGYPPYTVMYISILTELIALIARIWILNALIPMHISNFIIEVIGRSLLVFILAAIIPTGLSQYIPDTFTGFILICIITVSSTTIVLLTVGLKTAERSLIYKKAIRTIQTTKS